MAIRPEQIVERAETQKPKFKIIPKQVRRPQSRKAILGNVLKAEVSPKRKQRILSRKGIRVTRAEQRKL